MRFRFITVVSWALLGGTIAAAQHAPAPLQGLPDAGQRAGRGEGRGRGWGGGMTGRGVAGTVSEVAADHYTIKTLTGETYTIHYSANTRVVMQPAQRSAEAMRVPPQEIKPTEIRVGDVIMANGDVDAAAKSVGALAVVKIDPERARGRALGDARRGSRLDRIEAQGLAFHQRVRAGYLAIARTAPERIKLVRADQSIEELQGQIRELIAPLLARNTRNSKLETRNS